MRARFWIVVATLAFISVSGSSAPAGLVTVDTSALEPQVRSLIESSISGLREQQRNAEAWGHLGKVLHAHGLYEEAIESYAQAGRLNPKEYRWFYLAALASSAAAAEGALELYRRAYELEPGDYSLCITYGDSLTRLGRLRPARQVYEQAQLVDSRRGYGELGLARLAFIEGNLNEARSRLMRAREVSPRNSEIHLLLAQVFHRLGEPEAAADSMWRARSHGSRLRPRSEVVAEMSTFAVSISARRERGALLMERGNLQAARDVFQGVLSEQLSRGSATDESYGDLANVVLAEGAYRQARDLYSRGLVLRSENVALMTGLAEAHVGLADDENGAKWLQAALAGNAKYAPAIVAMGQLRIRQRRYPSAIEYLEEALTLDPTLFVAHGDLGRVYEVMGDVARAYQARERLRKLDPLNVANLQELSRLQMQRGDTAGAIGSLRRVFDLKPNSNDAAFNLAMLLATTAETASADAVQALEIAERLYRLNRHSARHADLLGIANGANGRFAEATKLSRRALDLVGENDGPG
ncbi:MAG: tetratricopeptide repeat protein [Gammaproteobacteria bacterium]|nr:tetratricopeptide repeat protein [Gammaproteobacteria bacterium]